MELRLELTSYARLVALFFSLRFKRGNQILGEKLQIPIFVKQNHLFYR